MLRGRTTRDTYVCPLTLPSGARIEEILVFGLDNTATGYIEASVWRTDDQTFGPNYFSNFGGVWQSSGLAATPFQFSFPIFTLGTPPHTMISGGRYTLGIALIDSINNSGNTGAYGFRVRYSIP